MMKMDMISREDFYEKLSLPRKAVVTITINPVQLDIIKYEILFDKSCSSPSPGILGDCFQGRVFYIT